MARSDYYSPKGQVPTTQGPQNDLSKPVFSILASSTCLLFSRLLQQEENDGNKQKQSNVSSSRCYNRIYSDLDSILSKSIKVYFKYLLFRNIFCSATMTLLLLTSSRRLSLDPAEWPLQGSPEPNRPVRTRPHSGNYLYKHLFSLTTVIGT